MDHDFITYVIAISKLKLNIIYILMPLEDSVNPLECKGNYGGTSNNMKLVHWLLIGGLLHLVQRKILAFPNVTAHPSTNCTNRSIAV